MAETDRLLGCFPGRAFRFVIPSARHTLAMGLDDWDPGVQGTVIGIGGSIGIGFVGDDVNGEELSTWSLGGLRETGLDASGKSWTGYSWLKSLLENPANTPSVLQLE